MEDQIINDQRQIDLLTILNQKINQSIGNMNINTAHLGEQIHAIMQQD